MRRSLLALGITGLLVAPAMAGAHPRLVLGLGFARGSSNADSQVGASAAASLLWPVAPRFDFGATLFADDLGSHLGRLRDPNDGTDLGAVADRHRFAYGGAWRGDVPFLLPSRWSGYASATWGYYRLQNDRLGVVQDAISAAGVGAALGALRPIGNRAGIGVSVRYQHLLGERSTDYGSASVDLHWSPGGVGTSRAALPDSLNSGS